MAPPFVHRPKSTVAYCAWKAFEVVQIDVESRNVRLSPRQAEVFDNYCVEVLVREMKKRIRKRKIDT
jgi:hypothetical protein